MVRYAWFIAKNDLTHMLRQRETILWVFIMPILFFYFIGTVTGGYGSVGGSPEAPDPMVLRAPARGGFLEDEIVRRLQQQNFAVNRTPTDEEWANARRRLFLPDPPAGYPTFSEAVLAGWQAVLKFDRRGDDPGAQFDQVRVARAVYGVLADLAVVRGQGSDPGEETFAQLAAMPRALSLKVITAGARPDPPSGFAQAVPGIMVMFTMLVLLTSGAIMLVVERKQGLLRRLASAPIPRASVVLGKWMARMALGLVQIAFAMVMGTLLFRMNWGPTLPMIAIVLFGWAALNASLAILLGNLARSEGQTAGLGVLSTMILAALGGCWWPIEITPGWMQTFAMSLPTGWTMDALHKLISFGYGAQSALPHVAVLLLAALAAGWISVRTFRYH
jgi:ABC-2 type transport system permease protein